MNEHFHFAFSDLILFEIYQLKWDQCFLPWICFCIEYAFEPSVLFCSLHKMWKWAHFLKWMTAKGTDFFSSIWIKLTLCMKAAFSRMHNNIGNEYIGGKLLLYRAYMHHSHILHNCNNSRPTSTLNRLELLKPLQNPIKAFHVYIRRRWLWVYLCV